MQEQPTSNDVSTQADRQATASDGQASPADPTVTLAVVTYNGAARGLESCLQALLDQDFPSARRELVVVDDASSDGSAELATRMGCRVVRHARNGGIGAARQSAYLAAQGDLVVFTDDDCVARPDWVSTLVGTYTRDEVVAVGGRVMGPSIKTLTQAYSVAAGYGQPAPRKQLGGSSPLRRFADYVRSMATDPLTGAAVVVEVQAIYTANASYRRKALARIGGFDPALRASEDADVSERLHRDDPAAILLYNPAAIVEHEHESSFRHLLSQTYRRAGWMYVAARKLGQVPAVFPFPCVVLAGTTVAALAGSPLAVVVFLGGSPLALYAWWLARTTVPLARRPLFAYMQLAVESASNAGVAGAWLRDVRWRDVGLRDVRFPARPRPGARAGSAQSQGR